MSESKEPIVFINWQEIRRWCSRVRLLVVGLYYLAILALIFEAFYVAIHMANLPTVGRNHWTWIHAGSLVGLELVVLLLTLVRRQRRGGEWSAVLTLSVL